MNNYERITASILKALDTDLPAWRQPWRTLRERGAPCVPVNAVTGRAYRGINTAILWSRQDADMRYMTYRQAQQHGGNVRKGEHGEQIVFWKRTDYKTRDAVTGEEEDRHGLMLKVYTVFNVNQCDNVKLPGEGKAPAPLPPPPVMVESFARVGCVVDHGGDRAYYAPGPDKIVMPRPEAFTSADAYAATGLHEMVHWTGHAGRLAREFGKRFGDRAYAAEELVAELGSAYLCAHLGVDCALEHHASYVQNWRQLLTDDSRAVFTAASKAQAAADFLLGKLGQDGAEAADNTEEVQS